MTDAPPTLDFYTKLATMTSPGRHASLFEGLPLNVAELTRVIQGLLIHEHLAADYGVVLSDARRSEVHIRTTEARLSQVLQSIPGRSRSIGP